MKGRWVALPSVPPVDEVNQRKYLQVTVEDINRQMFRLFTALDQISLGSPDGGGNIAGKWVTYTTSGAEDAIPHEMGAVPVGFFLLVPPQFGFINNGSTPWTSNNIYLTCGESGQTVTIFVLASLNPAV